MYHPINGAMGGNPGKVHDFICGQDLDIKMIQAMSASLGSFLRPQSAQVQPETKDEKDKRKRKEAEQRRKQRKRDAKDQVASMAASPPTPQNPTFTDNVMQRLFGYYNSLPSFRRGNCSGSKRGSRPHGR